MKNFYKTGIAAMVILTILSCDNNSDYPAIVDAGPLKIDSIMIENDTMQINTIQKVTTYSDFAANCEFFDGYDYRRSNFDRMVTSYKVKTDAACGSLEPKANYFDFRPEMTGIYLFKFWQGTNAAAEDVWLEKKIVVIE